MNWPFRINSPFIKLLLLLSPELFLQFAVIHFNQSGAAMRAGVRHGALAQVVDEVFQLRPGQRVVGLNGMPADRFGDGLLSQA